MKEIDYDAYLKNFQDLATNQKDIIKKYLEQQCEKDEALKALYRPTHIDGCYNFIMECVRKTTPAGNAVVEDAIVFKMARDYFIEILPTVSEDAPEIKTEEVKAVQETVEDVAQQIEEDAEEKQPEEEKLEIQSVEQEEEHPAEQPDEVQYDENGNGMLFSF